MKQFMKPSSAVFLRIHPGLRPNSELLAAQAFPTDLQARDRIKGSIGSGRRHKHVRISPLKP